MPQDKQAKISYHYKMDQLKKAEAELLKIARLTKSYIHSRVPLIARKHLEYRIAKDEDLLNEILQVQIEILQTWGGYDSLYTVEGWHNEKSIGEAAINYKISDIFATLYMETRRL